MNIDDFINELKKINININDEQLKQFNTYYTMLIEWNNKVNLTAITKEDEVYEKHFFDCILASLVIDFDSQNTCDVGAGAGFPSIPLKIIYPNLKITIVDSLGKRITFLNELKDKLGIEVNAIHARAEEFALLNRNSFDIVMARAVARLNILNELCIPLVKKDGFFIALKGKSAEEEINEAKNSLNVLNASIFNKIKYTLPGDDSIRYLISIQKNEDTSKKYPRMFTQIKKKPL